MVHLLATPEDTIGLAIFEYGIEDDRIYYYLSLELASAIYGARLVKQLEDANQKLKQAQAEILQKVDLINARTKELEEINRRLSELDKLKNDFIVNLTHDFRSPLMIILNNLDLILKYDSTLTQNNA